MQRQAADVEPVDMKAIEGHEYGRRRRLIGVAVEQIEFADEVFVEHADFAVEGERGRLQRGDCRSELGETLSVINLLAAHKTDTQAVFEREHSPPVVFFFVIQPGRWNGLPSAGCIGTSHWGNTTASIVACYATRRDSRREGTLTPGASAVRYALAVRLLSDGQAITYCRRATRHSVQAAAADVRERPAGVYRQDAPVQRHGRRCSRKVLVEWPYKCRSLAVHP